MRVEQSGAAKAAKPAGAKKGGLFSVGPSASKNELVLFTRQLSTMVGAGLALLESLDVLHEQAESPGMKKATALLVNEVRSGVDLSAAMEKAPKAFDALDISMGRAGEVPGQMDVILERLADYQEASEHLRREIRAAMTYPCISMVLVMGITAFLMLGVVPGFRAVFDSMDADLPGITQFTLNTAEYMKAHW